MFWLIFRIRHLQFKVKTLKRLIAKCQNQQQNIFIIIFNFIFQHKNTKQMYRTKDKLYLVNIFFTIANQHTHTSIHARNETVYNFTQNLIFHNIICCFSETSKKKLLLVISFRDITTQTTTNIPNSPIAKVATFHSE